MTKHVPESQLAPLRVAIERARAQTHCTKGGHMLTVAPNGLKRCLPCRAEASRKNRLKKKRQREELCARAFPTEAS